MPPAEQSSLQRHNSVDARVWTSTLEGSPAGWHLPPHGLAAAGSFAPVEDTAHEASHGDAVWNVVALRQSEAVLCKFRSWVP